MKRNNIAWKITSIILLAFLLLTTVALAANDPGHDILYVEEQGDSELNGSLNITGNVSIEGVLYSGANLDVRGDSVQESGDNQLIGTSSGLSIQSVGDLYINTFQGTASTVYLGDGGGDSVNINISGALFFGSSGRLAVASGTLAGSDLYWGDKLVCDASETNCGWATGVAAGDITSVQSDNTYIYNGSDIGAVYLLFNETKLNATIEAKATTLGGDGNNYTTAAGFVTSGSTETLQIAIAGRPNVTASFTDTDTTYSNGTGLGLSGQTFSLAAGVMTAGSYGNSTAVTVCTYDTYGRATSCTNTSITFPESSGDGNNYTTAFNVTNGTTHLITISTSGRPDITAQFTDLDTDTWMTEKSGVMSNITSINTTLWSIGNYSADRTAIQANITNVNTTANSKINSSTAATFINVSTGLTYQTGTENNCSAAGSCINILYTTTNFDNTSTSDIDVSGTYGALDLQIKPDIVNGAELADSITLDANLAITGYNVSIDAGTLFIDSNEDYVGIGTTDPVFSLDIVDSVNDATGVLIENYDGGTWAQSGVMFYTDSATGGFSTYGSGYTGAGGLFGHFAGRAAFGVLEGGGTDVVAGGNISSDIRFYTNGSLTTNERMRIDATGKVGIGDSTPEAILDIQNSSSINQLRVSYDDTNFGNISVNSGGNMTIKATGHVIIDLS